MSCVRRKENTLPRPEPGSVDTDTIAAVATAPGFGGIGVVRVSGPLAGAIGRQITGQQLEARRAAYRTFVDGAGAVIDNGIALWFPGPGSFTGEDVLELQGHGGPVVLRLLLDAAIALGARSARAGEFTERAFLNGKLDLAQAEAVADLIASSSEAAARGAMRSLQGEFSSAVNAIDAQVLELRVFVEAALDFPEEDVDFLEQGQVNARLERIAAALAALCGDARQGVMLRDGAAVALVGAPNVGKSSLLNRLAGEERAIVTDIPGTTRDVIPVDLLIDGLPIRLVDTAGLRDSIDPVEREGVRRAREQARLADLVIILEDARDADSGTLPVVARELLDGGFAAQRLIRVRNKIDLGEREPGPVRKSPQPEADRRTGIREIRVSALTGEGIDALREEIRAALGFRSEGTIFSARQRHLDALGNALTALHRGRELLASGAPAELLAEELRGVHGELGSIVGLVSADDLLGEIFSSFCIGK